MVAVGAASYNAAHTLTTPAILARLGALLGSHLVIALAAIWVAHIGLDHMVGYGLKYATGFADSARSASDRPRQVAENACAGPERRRSGQIGIRAGT